MTRRQLAGVAAFTIVPRHVLGGRAFTPPSDRVTLASIGMGRQGMAVTMDLLARPDVQVVAVCDPNQGSLNYAEYGRNATLTAARRLLGPGYERWGDDLASPGEAQLTHTFKTSLGMGGRDPAKRLVEAYYGGHKPSGAYTGCHAYRDFRELLDGEKDLDAVYVATPDHWHAPIAIAAMRKRKHVLGQKPMCHSTAEARQMAETAREMRVATSLTVSDPSSAATRNISAWIADGAIGKVREVHNWSSRPYWPQGIERPKESVAVPPGLDWDLWLGGAPKRPYHPIYQPFSWRGWYDFGCGALGDMGCYSFAGIFKVLGLGLPVSVEASSSEQHTETYPLASMVHYEFPGGLKFSWYDGGLKPRHPAGVAIGREGVMYVGDKGIIAGGFNGQDARVYPGGGSQAAAQRSSRDNPIEHWLAACKGGSAPPASFEAQRTVTEALLWGNAALRKAGEKLSVPA